MAYSYVNAVDRVLALHPNKFVKTKPAWQMDLINAQALAKANSKKTKDTQYFVILNDDEFEVKDFKTVKPNDDVYSVWRNGIKIDSPEGKSEQPEKSSDKVKTNNKKETVMSTTKTKPAKKAKAKKSPAKGTRKFEAGKIVDISIADMRAKMKKGYTYRDPQGILQPESYLKTRAKQDHVRTGMHEYKPA
jgi:hypothetical protein